MPQGIPSWVRQALASEDEVVYLLDEELRLAACNPGWEKFAAENGGVGISAWEVKGRSIFDFIPAVLVKFYEDKYAEAQRGNGWVGFDYECSSPDTYRLFHMSIYRIPNSYLIVVNSHLRHRIAPLPQHEASTSDADYRFQNGFLSICAHCRRTRRSNKAEVWDWVPRFLVCAGPKVKHELCPRCTAYHYSGQLSVAV